MSLSSFYYEIDAASFKLLRTQGYFSKNAHGNFPMKIESTGDFFYFSDNGYVIVNSDNGGMIVHTQRLSFYQSFLDVENNLFYAAPFYASGEKEPKNCVLLMVNLTSGDIKGFDYLDNCYQWNNYYWQIVNIQIPKDDPSGVPYVLYGDSGSNLQLLGPNIHTKLIDGP